MAELGLFGSPEEAVGAVVELTPSGRLGEVTDMADAVVFLASDAPLDAAAWRSAIASRDLDWAVIDGAALDAWVGDSPVLTDDYAPVDQLLTPYARPTAATSRG